ncbi:hypothetical protein ET132_12385, partial [Klebsiella pneumoniae]
DVYKRQSYDAAKNEISPPNGTSYTASEISIKRVPDGLCRVSNSLVKTIEYNGNAGGVMTVSYTHLTLPPQL